MNYSKKYFSNNSLASLLSVMFVVLFSFSSNAQLSGSYTIGTTGDYLTFNEAVDTLKSQGVVGPVVFDVQDGNYTEQFVLNEISGASLINTITFQSLSQDSTAVTLLHTAAGSSDNYVVKMDSADFFIFKQLGFLVDGNNYAVAFRFMNGASNNTLTNCLFLGKVTSSSNSNYSIIYSSNSADHNNTFTNNVFYDGSLAFRYQGESVSVLSTGTSITNNEFYNQNEYAIYLWRQDAVVVDNNTMELSNGFAYGCRLDNCDKNIQVTNNKINVQIGYEAFRFYYCDGSGAQQGDISNNFVTVSGSTTAYGMYFETCKFQNVFHNSVYVNSTNTTSGRAVYVNGNSGTNLDFRNNIFANFGGGYAFYTGATGTISNLDYNDYFTTGNFLAYWGSNQEDLAAFVSVSGMNANSTDVNPVFATSTDLHTTTFRLNAIGDATTGITTDIDGDARAGSPDIGADEFTGVGVALAGAYTIGGTTPDFATLTDAVDSLNEVGISADVIFNIRSGTYSEQVSILDIAGATAANRITFQSEALDSSLVEITFSTGSSNNYIVQLLATDYVTIKHLTLSATGGTQSTVLDLWGSTRSDSLTNCVINGVSNADDLISSMDQLFNDLVISNNSINSGYYGVRLDGYDGAHSIGVEVNNNTISGQTGICLYLEDCDACSAAGNTVTSIGSSSFEGIYLEDCDNDITVVKNDVQISGNANGGILLANCTGTTSSRGLIANNFVITQGTGISRGIYTSNNIFLNIFHNSVRTSSTSSSSGRAFYNSGGSDIDVRNNIFSNFGPGYAYYNITSLAIATSDYNNIMTTGIYVGYWGGANRTDLLAFQSANSMDVNSVSVNPGFVSSTDLHSSTFFLDSAGTPLASVTDDFDGDARNPSVPDIGADEFTATQFPLNGAYTIGGSSPDYVTINDAVDDLNTLGISGWVTFYIRNGAPYVEQMKILEISGANATDTVTFTADTNNVSPVVITYSAGSSDDWIFWLNNADFVTISNLTMGAMGTSYSKVIVLSGYTTNINILNNLISSANLATGSSSIYCSDNITEGLLIKNNTIVEGGNGIFLNGNNSTFSSGTRIDSNIFDGQAVRAIDLEDQTDPWIIGNEISNSSATSYQGIELNDVDNGFRIIGNKIISSQTNYGIRTYNCNATLFSQSFIENNFIQVGGTSTAYGLDIVNCDYVNIRHNNVNITSTHASNGRAFYLSGGTNITLQNNVLANTGGGYTYYIATTSAITISDYNDLYTTGTNIGSWAGVGNVTDLSALQVASSMDANSVSVDPMFTSATDLHIGEVALMEAATPLGVQLDFDGQQRDLATPDIGADEFFCETPTFSVLISDPCLGDSTTFKDNSTVIEPGSTWVWDFDNDFVTDYSSSSPGETINYLYSSGGAQTANLIITQIAGCVDTLVMTPVINTFPVLALSSTGVYCDSSNGTATVTASSGTAPYTYTWSSGATSSVNTGLDLGLYTVAVTDINNCTTLDTVSVNESMGAVVTLISGSTCGNSDGIAQVTNVTGGVPPYDYVWSTGDTTDTDSSLYSGIHYVSVIDVNGCVVFGTVNVSDIGSGVNIGLSGQTNNNCNGEENGAINISVTGVSPHTFTWSNAATTEDISGLGEGTYEVIVTDATGCIATASYNITAPGDITAAVVVSHASCGTSDGSAVVVASGGVMPYSYAWNIGGSNQIKAGLSQGIYAVTVTDASGCTEVVGVVVSNVGGPVISVNSVTEVNCIDSTIGAINIDVTGGAPAYTYNWSNAAASEDISGLTAGNYTVTVTDVNGCAASASIDIDFSTPVKPDICVVTVDTITGTNIIVWEKQAGQNIDHYNIYREGTASGIYFLIGSTPFDSLSVLIDSFADPQLKSWRYRISAVDSCGQESQRSGIHKTLHLTVNVGLGGEINLIWDEYSGFFVSTYTIYRGPSVSNLSAINFVAGGNHSYVDPAPPAGTQVYVVSADPPGGCTATKQKNFNSSKSNTSSVGTAPDSLGTSTVSSNATQGNCDGSAIVSVTGGVTPYTFAWNTTPPQTDSVATGLCGGTYNVIITDAQGDTISSTVTVQEDLNLAGSTSVNNATAGNCDGNATVSAVGGTPPYTYAWNTSPPQTDTMATGLCAGSYSVTVTDAVGDTIFASVTITENANLAGTATSTNATSGNCDGTATVNANGGTPAYTYTWNTSPVQNDSVATGLCPGSYSCTVQDGVGGLVIVNIVVNEDVALSATGVGTDATFGNCDGTATITAAGGTPPYTYTWNTSPTQNDSIATGLCGGNYSCTVQDATGGLVIENVTVDQLTSIEQLELESSLSLFPNPNKGSFNVTFNYRNGASVMVRVFDMKGAIVWSQEIQVVSINTQLKIELTDGVSGIYQLQLISGTGMVTRKVLVE